MNKSFKGKLDTGDQQTIRLSTNKGEQGYQIIKIAIIGQEPQGTTQESTLQVFSTKRSTITSTMNFDDPSLLGVAYWSSSNSSDNAEDMTVVIDNKIVNQDIFITHVGTGSTYLNYYIELEQVKLSKDEAAVATLKDMRGRE